MQKLTGQLYDNVPEFSKVSDHLYDGELYIVYGELSLKLFREITTNKEQPNLFAYWFGTSVNMNIFERFINMKIRMKGEFTYGSVGR